MIVALFCRRDAAARGVGAEHAPGGSSAGSPRSRPARCRSRPPTARFSSTPTTVYSIGADAHLLADRIEPDLREQRLVGGVAEHDDAAPVQHLGLGEEAPERRPWRSCASANCSVAPTMRQLLRPLARGRTRARWSARAPAPSQDVHDARSSAPASRSPWRRPPSGSGRRSRSENSAPPRG